MARPNRRRAESLTLGEGKLDELKATGSDCAHIGSLALPESPDLHPDASPLPLEALFPLDRDQVIAAVAYAMSLLISNDRTAELDPKLAIFDESKIEGPAFHGGEDEIKALLNMMVGLGLDPNVSALPPRSRSHRVASSWGCTAMFPRHSSHPQPPPLNLAPLRPAPRRRSSSRASLSTGSCCSSAATRARARMGGSSR
jgi:hypothetical protein